MIDFKQESAYRGGRDAIKDVSFGHLVVMRFREDADVKQIYLITYPTGKIYVGKDTIGSHRYFGSPDMDVVNDDFQTLPDAVRKDYTVRKQILWESETASDEELSAKEVEFIRKYQSNNPEIGYNRWPKAK